ncbi:unnamed protein product [Owenia fusiformis]|uniref:Uncharacterized protein n=1 Tax=Owenia fusiformis TaxID=6347 RepID=A0A8J1Y6R0_OWEFU|nr:unnamed protein product [Owenia fusiformis]
MPSTELQTRAKSSKGAKEKKPDPFAEELVTRKLMRNGILSHAIVINASNFNVRANQPITFRPSRSTRKALAKLIQGDTMALNPDGIDLGIGKVYMPGKVIENRELFATDGHCGGFTAFLVKDILVLGVFNHNVETACRLITEVANFVRIIKSRD